MKKIYLYIVTVYIVTQFSSFIGIPLFRFISHQIGITGTQANLYAAAYWTIFSFTLALFIILLLLRKEFTLPADSVRNSSKSSVGNSILWALGGIILAFYAQSFSAMIEMALGIKVGSQNTQLFVSIIAQVPLFALVTSIIGPILEEIVFRKIIFGELHKRWNFFYSALISSIIFGAAHMEFTHIINYTLMGFTFAFLYAKTKRIIVPIIAHVMMNSIVVFMHLYKDEILKFIDKLQQSTSFIGGLL